MGLIHWLLTPLRTTAAFVNELITDDSKRPSLAKTMLFCGWLAITALLFKMIIEHTMTIEYMIVYCAFISGQHLTSKFIDSKTDNS
jgi:hypothetical protein